MKYTPLLVLLLVVLGSTLVIAGCDEDLIDDATFRLWCGDALCSWRLDAGHVRQAPTWHRADHGVELIDTPTTISQELKNTAQCLVFTSIADVDPEAQVWIGLDFDGDGKPDYESPLAAVAYREVKVEITSPRIRETIRPRLSITKKGVGRAVLAQIRLQGKSDCTAPPLRLANRPLGDPCTQPSNASETSECRSGVCCEGVCAECCENPQPLDFVADGGALVSGSAPEVACADGGVCARRDAKQAVPLGETVPLQCE